MSLARVALIAGGACFHFNWSNQGKTEMRRWKVKRAQCTDGEVWIVRDTSHPLEYRMAADERDAVALAKEWNARAERERREAEAAAEAATASSNEQAKAAE
jgi:hypothetical protein